MAHALGSVIAALEAMEGASDLRLRQALDVAGDYAALLERSPADPSGVYDVADLPCEKEAIKHGLLTLLARTPEAGLREPLKLAYIRLADWQDAQPPPVAPIDLRSARTGRDPLRMASQLAAARTPPGERRLAAAREERARLIEELRRLGFG